MRTMLSLIILQCAFTYYSLNCARNTGYIQLQYLYVKFPIQYSIKKTPTNMQIYRSWVAIHFSIEYIYTFYLIYMYIYTYICDITLRIYENISCVECLPFNLYFDTSLWSFIMETSNPRKHNSTRMIALYHPHPFSGINLTVFLVMVSPTMHAQVSIFSFSTKTKHILYQVILWRLRC